MQVLIVIFLAIIAISVAPWLLGVAVVGAAFYGVFFLIAIGVAVAALVICAGYLLLVERPRKDRAEKQRRVERGARMQASDAAIAEQKRATAELIEDRKRAASKATADEEAIQAEVDEQIREAKIRKDLKARH